MRLSKEEYRKVYEMANGFSAGICIPKQYLKNLSLVAGDFVKIHQEENTIVIQKA